MQVLVLPQQVDTALVATMTLQVSLIGYHVGDGCLVALHLHEDVKVNPGGIASIVIAVLSEVPNSIGSTLS